MVCVFFRPQRYLYVFECKTRSKSKIKRKYDVKCNFQVVKKKQKLVNMFFYFLFFARWFGSLFCVHFRLVRRASFCFLFYFSYSCLTFNSNQINLFFCFCPFKILEQTITFLFLLVVDSFIL